MKILPILGYTGLTLLGALFFLYQESWLIFTSPFISQEKQIEHNQVLGNYKTVTLYALQQNKVKQESTEIIVSHNIAETIKLLLNSWLLFLEDEHINEQENRITSVVLSPSKQEAFISLQTYPFTDSWSTHKKLLWIESLLKTIQENNIPIVAIRLLIHHQPLIDEHLNFNVSWPITGFLSQ